MKLADLKPLLIALFICLSTWVSASPLSKVTTAVLPTIDQSKLNFAVPLQRGLARLLDETQGYKGLLSNRSINAFTPQAIQAVLDQEQTDALSFALLESNRISVFFFHRQHPKEFIVQSDFFNHPKELESKFRTIAKNLLDSANQSQYTLLPGQSKGDRKSSPFVYKSPKLEGDTRRLFREFASLSDTPFSLGAQIGMARFSNDSASSSTVIFGMNAGYQFESSFSLEVGASVSSYLLGNAGIRYSIPFAEKVVRLSVGVDAAAVLANITQNTTNNTSLNSYYAPSINPGTILAGPGFFFDIPLLGATMRGDLRLYTGSTSIFIGTYGFVFYL